MKVYADNIEKQKQYPADGKKQKKKSEIVPTTNLRINFNFLTL